MINPNNHAPRGVPVGGFELHSVPAKGLNASFSELMIPDSFQAFAAEFWREHAVPSITTVSEKVSQVELPSPSQIMDRIRAAIQGPLREAMTNPRMASDGMQLLERFQRQEEPFEELPKVIDDAIEAIPIAIEQYNESATRYSITAIQGFSRDLRATAESFAFETPVTIAKEADRLERLCRFTQTVESKDDVVPPLVRESILRSLKAMIFDAIAKIAHVILDDVLRERFVSVRKSCLDAADNLDAHVRHRVGRLEEITSCLQGRVDRARHLAKRQSDEQTILLPGTSNSEFMDRLAMRINAPARSEVGHVFVKKFEAALNQKAIEAEQIEEPFALEELLRRVSKDEAASVYESLLKRHLRGEESVFQAIASDVNGYADQLARRAMSTYEFAGRNTRRFGVESTLTAYIFIPDAEKPFEKEVRSRFLARIGESFKRVECSNNIANQIMLLGCLSPFVPGTQAGLLAGQDAFLELGDKHNPGLYGDEFTDVPDHGAVERYRKRFSE